MVASHRLRRWRVCLLSIAIVLVAVSIPTAAVVVVWRGGGVETSGGVSLDRILRRLGGGACSIGLLRTLGVQLSAVFHLFGSPELFFASCIHSERHPIPAPRTVSRPP